MSQNQLTKIVFAPLTWFILFCAVNLCTTGFFVHKVSKIHENYNEGYQTLIEQIKESKAPPKTLANKGKAAPQAPSSPLKCEKEQGRIDEIFQKEFYHAQVNWLNAWIMLLAIVLGIFGVAFPIIFQEQMKQYQGVFDEIQNKSKDTLQAIDNAQKSLAELKTAQHTVDDIKKFDLSSLQEDIGKIKQWTLEAEANALLSQGYYDEALAAFKKAVTANPRNEVALFNYGVILAKLKKDEDALFAYDRALKINPNMAIAHNNRGDILSRLGHDQDALSAYDKAIELKPDFAAAHFNRGTTLGKLGDLTQNQAEANNLYEEAAKSLERTVSLNPHFAEAHCNYGIALSKFNRHEEALAAYNRAIELEPNDANTRYYLGLTLEKLNRLDEALSAYNRAIFLKPSHISAHYCRGNVLEKLGHYKEALVSVEKALKLDPNNKTGIKTRDRLRLIINERPEED